MGMSVDELAEKMIDPGFDLETLNWDQKVTVASYALNNREIYQKLLGRLAASLPDDKRGRGSKGNVAKLAHDIEEHTGHKISIRTIHKYRQVYKALESLWVHIPADFPFSSWIVLSRQEDPASWLNRAILEGWSGAMLTREIYQINPPQKRIKICKHCGKEIPIQTCLSCGKTP